MEPFHRSSSFEKPVSFALATFSEYVTVMVVDGGHRAQVVSADGESRPARSQFRRARNRAGGRVRVRAAIGGGNLRKPESEKCHRCELTPFAFHCIRLQRRLVSKPGRGLRKL